MKPIPLIVSLGLVSGIMVVGSSLGIAQEVRERPLPRPAVSSPEERAEMEREFTTQERPGFSPEGRPGPGMNGQDLPSVNIDSDGDEGQMVPISVEPINLPVQSRRISRETLEQRRAEIQQMREQNRLTRCEIFETQLANVSSVRLAQNARIATRYEAVINRLEAIVSWLATQEVVVTEFEAQIEELKEQQQEYLRISQEYAQAMRELPTQCSGDEVSREARQSLEEVRQTARDLAATNAELRRAIRDDILTQLRALNV